MHRRLATLALFFVTGGCSSTYHPEYHPVMTVQQTASPAVVVPGDGWQRPVVFVAPPPAPPPTVPPPPPGFFAPE